jgi:Double-GTPase 2
MIQRSRRYLLHLSTLPIGVVVAGVLALQNWNANEGAFVGVGLWPIVALAAGLAWPVLVLLTIGLLRARALMDRSLYRICFTCPRCSHTGLPAFRCPGCKKAHADLKPSLHGVFFARCGTVRCGRSLPALNFLGRSRLEKICPKCGEELHHASLGKSPEYRIAIVGTKSGGKTNLLVAAVWQFEQVFAPANGLRVSFSSPDEEKTYRALVARLKAGQAMDKTLPEPVPHAFTLSVADEGGEQSCLLYLYDAAGEDFEDEQVLGGHPLDSYDALLFVVDLFAEEGAKRGALGPLDQGQVARANSTGMDAGFIAGRLVSALEKRLGVGPTGIFRVPVAVVVTKLDVCGVGSRLGIGAKDLDQPFPSFTAAVLRAERDHDRVRALLFKIGLGNTVQLLEQRFEVTCYFGASPLGRSLDLADSSSFRPRGVMAPLVWLCDRTNALGDMDPFDVVFINSHVYLARALRGKEGTAMRLGAWFGLAACVLVVVLLFLGLPRLLFILTCGVTLGPLLLLDLYLTYVLVYKRYEG